MSSMPYELETRRALWSSLHSRVDMDMLSGSDPEYVLSIHGLRRPTGKKVADIGYGTGTMAKYLRPDNEVVSFDIVESDGVLPIGSLREDSYDMAICHLVAQHNPPQDIPMLVPKLNPGGLFTIQFAASEHGVSGNQGGMHWMHDPDIFPGLLSPLRVMQRRHIVFEGDEKADELRAAGVCWWVFVCDGAGTGTGPITEVRSLTNDPS